MTNPRAERVRQVAALAGRPARERSGRFLVEGPQAVREAVRFAAASVRALYLSDEAALRHPEIAVAADDAGLLVRLGTPAVLDAMSADAQGIVAVVDRRAAALPDVLAGAPRLVALLAHVRDPGNAGTVIRTADAVGAGAVMLSDGSVDLHNPKTVRSTAGSLFHLPVVTGVELPQAVDALRGAGLAVLAADGGGDLDLDDLLDAAGSATGGGSGVPDLASPTAWLFGNEAWGLPADVLALADAAVRVPIRGAAESLNLATAAGICLYASARAQR
ncbi:MAG TPA: RNA methyltransferase [Cellulomonas sp.]